MSELLKAYTVLGLEPGSNPDAIQTRYKRLIMVWHPDRFPSAEGKLDAEEELKKILNARELLIKHFDSGRHKDSSCECSQTTSSGGSAKPSGGTQPRETAPSHGPGPGRSRTTPPRYPGGDAFRRPASADDADQPSDDQLKRWAQLEQELEHEERSDEIKAQRAAVDWLRDQKLQEQEAKSAKAKKKKQEPTLQDLLDGARDGKAPAKVPDAKKTAAAINFGDLPFVDECKRIMLAPVSFFEQMPADGSLKEPIMFVVTVAGINAIFWFLTDIMHPIHALLSAALGFVSLVAGSFLLAATSKAIAKFLGGQGTFTATYYACAYASAPNVLLWLPLINGLSVLYTAFLLKLALEYVQELSPGRSYAVVGIQLLVCVMVATQLFGSGALTKLDAMIPNDLHGFSEHHQQP